MLPDDILADDKALERLFAITPHIYQNVPLRSLSEHSGHAPSTLFSWVLRFRLGGLPALAERSRQRVPDFVKDMIFELAKTHPSVSDVHREVIKALACVGHPPPSYSFVHNTLRSRPRPAERRSPLSPQLSTPRPYVIDPAYLVHLQKDRLFVLRMLKSFYPKEPLVDVLIALTDVIDSQPASIAS